ncbi:MAG: hypothetical protein MUF34_09270 [Polyangiaceae bacterium]|jgi:hypothetical protein|nr:hypothetical protein [Polyangiaceae bacterium]
MMRPSACSSQRVLALVGVLLVFPAVARAAPPVTSDQTNAERLDEEGKKLFDQRRYDEACAHFSQSYRLSPGNGVLLRLGLCQERQGKTASAWLTFRDAVALARSAGNAQVESLAARRAAALEPNLARLSLQLDPAVGAIDQVSVTLDGVSLGRASLGLPMPVDPGSHVIEASAPGGRVFTKTIVIRDDGQKETVIVTFARAPGREVRLAQQPPATPPPARPQGWSTPKTLALISGGLGLVGLGTGVAFQLQVQARRDDAFSLCPTKRACSPEAIAARDDGLAAANVAAVAFAAGAAGVVGGLALWLVAPSSSSTPKSAVQVVPVVTAQNFEIQLKGAW